MRLLFIFVLFNINPAFSQYSGSTSTDQEGDVFHWINYASNDWAVENADVMTYRDGTPIPQVTDANTWANLTTGAWCYYNNDPSKGKLYNWYAVAGIHNESSLNDPSLRKEFAPEGWHVPSDEEWILLQNHLISNGYNWDGTNTGNKIAKSMASQGNWESREANGVPGNNNTTNNSSLFNSFPNGFRYIDGSFNYEGFYSFYWTSSSIDNTKSISFYINTNNVNLYRSEDYNVNHGLSVRIIRESKLANDQDGNSFLWENYGTLDWAIENVKVTKYSDGTTIPQVTDAAQWSTLTTGAWCYFENDPNNGKLYNWYAMSGNIAPDGWRVATDEDWNNLENYLIQNGFNFDGSESGNNIAKSMSSTSEWITSTVEGSPGKDPESNNLSGFNASPEGIRQSGGGFHSTSKGYFTIFGSSTEIDNQYFKRRSIGNENPALVDGQSGKKGGYSLRFVRDANTSPTYAPNDGMLAYYNFNGNSDDLSGNGYDGVVNGATLTVGIDENENSAYSFDGVDDYIHLENLPINLDPSNSYTFMFHVKTPLSVSQTGGSIISNYQNHSSQSELFIGVYNDVIRVWGDGSTPIQSCNNSSQDWRNVIVTIQGSTSKVYVDSQLVCTDTILINSGASSHSTFIGKTDCPTTSNQCNYFSGVIDELGVWDRVLSENEISNLSSSISTLSVNNIQRTIEEGVIIFPNPTSSIINIDYEFSIAKVFDLTGRKVLESTLKTIDLSELPNSIYLLRLYDNSNNVLGTSKVIKK